MNISLKNILLVLLVAPTLASCIRDQLEDCPPLRVEIGVKDKNYFNVDRVDMEQRLPDDLAFREYVPTLFYMLRDAATGEVVEEMGVFDVEGDGKTVALDFCPCLPHGKYILTVWGGLKDMSALSDDRLSMTLHPDKVQGDDVYMVNDTLVYDAYRYDYTVEMERIKGKLIVQAEGLPHGIEYSVKTVDNLFANLDCNFLYTGNTSVQTQGEWTGNKMQTKTFLSPSIRENASLLRVQMYDNAQHEGAAFSPKDVAITMRRNELTVLRYVWDEDKRKFVVYMLINDNWELLHGMEID